MKQKFNQLFDLHPWPYLTELYMNQQGFNTSALDRLEANGHIRRRRGINDTIIELINKIDNE